MNANYVAAVENYGSMEGNWAQLTPIALRDLQQLGLFKNITLDQVKGNPKLYQSVVDAYWKRMEDFGIPDDDYTKAIWWRAPGLYKRYGGDVSKIKDKTLRNVMENRVKNLDAYIKSIQPSPYTGELGDRHGRDTYKRPIGD